MDVVTVKCLLLPIPTALRVSCFQQIALQVRNSTAEFFTTSKSKTADSATVSPDYATMLLSFASFHRAKLCSFKCFAEFVMYFIHARR